MIAIIGPGEDEIGPLRSRIELERVRTVAGIAYYRGVIEGSELVLACSGPGRIPTAVALQAAFDLLEADAVVHIGAAAPLVPYLQHGDIVLAEKQIQCEVRFPGSRRGDEKAIIGRASAVADSNMVTRAQDTYGALFAGKSNRPQLVTGTVISADREITDRKTIGRLQHDFGAVAADREGATAAMVCRMNGRPYLAVRTIVDVIDRQSPRTPDSEPAARFQHAAALVERLVTEPAPVSVA